MEKSYTSQAFRVIQRTEDIALRELNGYIGSEHLLLALATEKCIASQVLFENGLKAEDLHKAMDQLVRQSVVEAKEGSIRNTPSLARILDRAEELAAKYESFSIGTDHLFLALLKEPECIANRLLNTLGIPGQKLYFATMEAMGMDPVKAKEEFAMSRSRTKKQGESILAKYSRDLTELAAHGKLDPVIGRNDEIDRVIRILSRKTKNNPCLVGEPGVGKTAVAEGLAGRLANNEVPDNMKGKKLLSLDLAAMVAGTKYRGEFEERMKRVIEEVASDDSIIIFIDELHTIIGAGSAEGALDASNIMKPALARGEFRVVGATTREEYRKHIEKDSALERRFQPVVVEEPTIAETEEILYGLRLIYEQHHGVAITDEAVKAAVRLSERYIADRYLPDKAIDVIDEAASMVHLTPRKKTQREKLSDRAEIYGQAKELAFLSGSEAFAKEAFKKERDAKRKLLKLGLEQGERPELHEEEVAAVISAWTKIPVSRLREEESERLKKLPDTLKKRVIGQADAVHAVSNAIKRARVGLNNPNRPIGSFLFLGPTGVGKTELAKALAETMFGKEDAMIRVDMSEYMEKHSVSKLIGSPPGYVGHEEGGQLSEQVRRNPYSLILFDELEKAHPDVFHILLQVLEDGQITDSQGRHVSFRNTIIIMTSNTGAQGIIEPKNLGFASKADADSEYEKMRQRVMDEVKQTFKPEFINRIDEIIVFRPLDEEALRQIASLTLRRVSRLCMEQKQIKLVIQKPLIEFIAKKGYDKKFGARPLRRAVQTYVEDRLADEILTGNLKDGDTASVSVTKSKDGEGKVKITVAS